MELTKKKQNIPGYNDDHKNVFSTLNGQYIGGSKHNITFERSPEHLLKQYSNLIHNMGRRFGNINMTYAERQDLYAYISEVFIDLVREFDMSNGMDFPGYIAKMLPTRIRGSYLDPIQDYKAHITPVKDPDGAHSVEELADLNYGKMQTTFSYSSKSKYNREVQKDGKVRGIVSLGVDNPNTNEIDNSLSEIHTTFKAQGYKKPELHELIDLLALKGLKPEQAKKVISKKYNLTNGEVEALYEQLTNLMIGYENY